MRVVSLTCSNTEIVSALGLDGLLVGVDDHSDFPADLVSSLPRVGPDLQIDIAKVAALEPDLVLASLTVPGHEDVVAGLEKAGLPYLAPEPQSLTDVYRDIRLIAGALGAAERGEAVVANMMANLRPTETAGSDRRPTILIQWWPKPVIAPARLSWATDLIQAAAGANPIGHESVKSRPLSDDEVRDLNPDAIVISWCGVRPEKYRPDVVYGNESWREVEALRKRRVLCIPEAYLGRPSPRLVQGFEALEQIVARVRQEFPLAPRS